MNRKFLFFDFQRYSRISFWIWISIPVLAFRHQLHRRIHVQHSHPFQWLQFLVFLVYSVPDRSMVGFRQMPKWYTKWSLRRIFQMWSRSQCAIPTDLNSVNAFETVLMKIEIKWMSTVNANSLLSSQVPPCMGPLFRSKRLSHLRLPWLWPHNLDSDLMGWLSCRDTTCPWFQCPEWKKWPPILVLCQHTMRRGEAHPE